MIIALQCGAHLVLSECHWAPGAYLATGNMRGSQGVIVDPSALDRLIDELTRIRDAIAASAIPKEEAA